MADNVYESIMAGLNDALEDAKSEKKTLKRNQVTVVRFPFVSNAVAK